MIPLYEGGKVLYDPANEGGKVLYDPANEGGKVEAMKIMLHFTPY